MSDSQRHYDIQTVFLDRGGVLNCKAPEGEYVSRPDMFHPLPGVEEAVHMLNGVGLRVCISEELATYGVTIDGYSTARTTKIHARAANRTPDCSSKPALSTPRSSGAPAL